MMPSKSYKLQQPIYYCKLPYYIVLCNQAIHKITAINTNKMLLEKGKSRCYVEKQPTIFPPIFQQIVFYIEFKTTTSYLKQ